MQVSTDLAGKSGGQGKVAIVTGAGSGIGRAVALDDAVCRIFGSVGWAAHGGAGKNSSHGRSRGRPMHPISTDVRQPDSVRALFAGTREKFGRLDVLFNNAGVNATGIPFEDLSYEQWCEVVNVNLTGSFLCAQEAFRLMKTQQPQGGRIINNGSISAHVPRPTLRPTPLPNMPSPGSPGPSRSMAAPQHCLRSNRYRQRRHGNDRETAAGALQPNGEMMVEPRMDAKHIGEAVVYMASLPLDANVQFMTVMATNMPLSGADEGVNPGQKAGQFLC
jgi:NAD(P)-dependent dehydrogenase (short-subunit alcohol dehydrogenase family)